MSTRAYTVDRIGGACPTQGWGHLADGRGYYFRARGGRWTLQVSPDPLTIYGSEPIADGYDPSMGGMSTEDVLAILDRHLAGEPS